MAKKKLREKSCIGWVISNWVMYKLNNIQTENPYIFHSIIAQKKSDLHNKKVRITIQELGGK